jgi:hypothetical protein
MRDSLALALVRAEFCRAYAAERARPGTKVKSADRSILVRLRRLLRLGLRSRASAPAA